MQPNEPLHENKYMLPSAKVNLFLNLVKKVERCDFNNNNLRNKNQNKYYSFIY